MRNCIVCKSDKKKEFFDSSVTVPSPYPFRGEQKIVACEKCGFIFSDSDNTEENYKEYYETLNKHKKRAADAECLDRSYYEKICKFIDPLSKDSSILDFGSGDLLMKSVLNERGFSNVTTFDIGSGKEPQTKFDLIISTHTFEHILDGDIMLKKLGSLLKDGGQLILAVPDVEGYLEYYCGPYNWFDLEHINHFSATSIRNFVKNKGLSVISCIRDKREVRPGLFYPEVIIHCIKNDFTNAGLREDYEYDMSSKILQDYIAKSKYDFDQVLQFIKKEAKKRIIIRGLGISAMRIIHHLNFNNIDADFVDSDPRLQGRTLKGRKILSPEELNNMNLDDAIIIVAAVNYKDIIKTIPDSLSDKVRVIKY